jgi:hypothetical protein
MANGCSPHSSLLDDHHLRNVKWDAELDIGSGRSLDVSCEGALRLQPSQCGAMSTPTPENESQPQRFILLLLEPCRGEDSRPWALAGARIHSLPGFQALLTFGR